MAGQERELLIDTLVEKPRVAQAPSTMAVVGRYALHPRVFDYLAQVTPGAGGEIQLTDALREMARERIAGGVFGVIFRGRRYDTGDKLDYIKAIVRLALQRPDLGPQLERWLEVESHRHP